MWVFIVFTSLLTLISSNVNSNQFVNSNEQSVSSLPTISVMPIQLISNSSLNSSLMESQLQEQISLSNTSLMDLQNDNNTQQLQIRFRER
jgi:ABC-type multidrug transport system permease subunit